MDDAYADHLIIKGNQSYKSTQNVANVVLILKPQQSMLESI